MTEDKRLSEDSRGRNFAARDMSIAELMESTRDERGRGPTKDLRKMLGDHRSVCHLACVILRFPPLLPLRTLRSLRHRQWLLGTGGGRQGLAVSKDVTPTAR